MADIAIEKQLALLEEFETSYKLIQLGFGELQNINIGNDFYFLPFQLLSQGIERLFKSYICVAFLTRHLKLPSHNEIKAFGHDLIKLFTTIKREYYIKYSPPIFEEDWEFMHNNNILEEIIDILSDFGKQARYYNFDLITSNPKLGQNPKERWQILESKILPMNEELIKNLMNPDLEKEVYPQINRFIILNCEKMLVCLARQISFGTLGSMGKQFTCNNVFRYVSFRKEDFGKTNYRENTTAFKQLSTNRHKRGIMDFFYRKFNKNYKNQVVKRVNYNGDWPFYADTVIIECRMKHWCIVSIDGYDYALNGSAKGRYKLDNPFDAGVAIPGKSISEFITMALSL